MTGTRPSVAPTAPRGIPPHQETTSRTGWSTTVTRFVDGILDVSVAALAWWTLVYVLLLLGMPMVVGFVVWGIGTTGLALARSRRRWVPSPAAPTALDATIAALTALAMAALSSVISRPEWDDASFVVRSTWVADHGAPAMRDMIFTDGVWPGTIGLDPNLSSIETLFGAVARYTGASAGDVVYRYFVPAATFAAVWAVWLLLRVWRARRPAASLVVAMGFIVLGGYSHATWGNFHLARIWQGKVVLVAILVPYLYAVLFAAVSAWTRRPGAPQRRSTPLVLLGVGLAGVGASTTAIFVIPLIAAAVAASLLWRRRVGDAILLAAAASAGPVVAGIVTVLSPDGSGNQEGRATQWLWSLVLADPRVAAVAVLCALSVVAGVRWPHRLGSIDPRAQAGLAVVLISGFLCTVPPIYPALTVLIGGDAIAYRLAWVLPLPAVIGLIASLPARRWAAPVLPATSIVLAVLLVAGQPLWAGSNLASIGRPGTWKVRSQDDLATARWIVEQRPEGRYLAPNWVAFMVGVITSDLRPVGTRLDYVRSLEGVPGSQVEDRVLLQRIADGGEIRSDENLVPALEALEALDVSVACVVWNEPFTDELMSLAGFEPGYAQGPWTCWSRADA